MFKKFKIAAGIIARRVFTGPLEVAIDITNRCSTGCITCWFYSPLIKEKVSEEWLKKQMSLELFMRIVDELKGLEVKRLMIGADGDPFMHPQIIEILEYATKAKFKVATSTCGLYFNEENLRRLFDSGLDELNISILAATPQTYCSMHPRQKAESFEKIKQSILKLSEWKKQEKKKLPFIRLINVICNLNYFEADKMISLAKETGVDLVDFKRLATIPSTESLLLNINQVKELDENLGRALEHARLSGIANNIKEFRSRAVDGLTSGDYTLKLYSQIPCYIGWIYARVLSDGSVVPCCGCWNYRIGDLNQHSFKEIWHSKEYYTFRKKSIKIKKDDSITKECACQSCVHSGMNLGIYRRMHFLSSEFFS